HSGQLAETSAAKLKRGQINGEKTNKYGTYFGSIFLETKEPNFFKSFASFAFSSNGLNFLSIRPKNLEWSWQH
ncbi:MAG: hypothetical protein ACK55I_03285, partial [bacterium]